MSIAARKAAYEKACRAKRGQDMAHRRYVLAVAAAMDEQIKAKASRKKRWSCVKLFDALCQIFVAAG